MITALRLAGWTLFGAGAAVFIANGSFRNLRSPLTMAAMIAMPAGMILTMTSNLIAWKRWMSRRAGARAAEPPPPPPSANPSPGPEKRYAPRPLDPEKIKPPDPPPAGPA